MNSRVLADIYFDHELSVWRLANGQTVPYSDGKCTEAYLRKVLKSSTDLSSSGQGVEKHILDWSSEYNLSHKRTQLLRGFPFDRHQKVLEVGCGCGAITRFLGETFDEVIAIEGSLERASIARLRTRDQSNVHIINAPFQDIDFKEKFDLVFCIGVFEYAQMFVDAPNPYDHVLKRFHDFLSPDGILILAIENQFGLTYFCSNPEDHTAIMFNGVEGYHQTPDRGRTFGYGELKKRVQRHFPKCDFYFPYPDYKLPSCVISEELANRVDIGGLIGEFASAPSPVARPPLFDARLALTEVSKNGMLPVFANSFLLFASKGEASIVPDWLGILYSTARRRPEFRTRTRFVDEGGSITVDKELLSGGQSTTIGAMTLRPSSRPWIHGEPLVAEVTRRTKNRKNTLQSILEPTLPWYAKLESLCTEEGGVLWLDGKYLDAIWSNTFVHEDTIDFIDLEWEWQGKVRLSYVVIRAFVDFFRDRREKRISDFGIRRGSLRQMIVRAARIYGLRMTSNDFHYYISMSLELEGAILAKTSRLRRLRRVCAMNWRLRTNPSGGLVDNLFGRACWLLGKLRKRVAIRFSGVRER